MTLKPSQGHDAWCQIQDPSNVVHLGHIANSQYKIAQKAMSFFTKMHIALEIQQVREHLVSHMCTIWVQCHSLMTENSLDGCWHEIVGTQKTFSNKCIRVWYGVSFTTSDHGFIAADSDWSLTKSRHFTTVTLVGRWCSNSCVATLVRWEERCSHNFSWMVAVTESLLSSDADNV